MAISKRNRRIKRKDVYKRQDVEFIAKEIVMLSNGKIIRSGSPSKLLKELDGTVWNIFLSDNEIDEVNTGYKVSNISRDADGVIALSLIHI